MSGDRPAGRVFAALAWVGVFYLFLFVLVLIASKIGS